MLTPFWVLGGPRQGDIPVLPAEQWHLLTSAERRLGERLGRQKGSRAGSVPAEAWREATRSCACSPTGVLTLSHPAGAQLLLWCVGNCRLWVVAGFYDGCSLRPHLCIPSAQGARRTHEQNGHREPYLFIFKKSLIAFCNCTVDKCSKSPWYCTES